MTTPSPVLLTIHTCQICQRALFTGTHDRVSSISEPFSSKIVCISSVHKVDQHWSKLITAISLMSITMVSYSHKSVEYSTSLYFHYCILWNRLTSSLGNFWQGRYCDFRSCVECDTHKMSNCNGVYTYDRWR